MTDASSGELSSKSEMSNHTEKTAPLDISYSSHHHSRLGLDTEVPVVFASYASYHARLGLDHEVPQLDIESLEKQNQKEEPFYAEPEVKQSKKGRRRSSRKEKKEGSGSHRRRNRSLSRTFRRRSSKKDDSERNHEDDDSQMLVPKTEHATPKSKARRNRSLSIGNSRRKSRTSKSVERNRRNVQKALNASSSVIASMWTKTNHADQKSSTNVTLANADEPQTPRRRRPSTTTTSGTTTGAKPPVTTTGRSTSKRGKSIRKTFSFDSLASWTSSVDAPNPPPGTTYTKHKQDKSSYKRKSKTKPSESFLHRLRDEVVPTKTASTPIPKTSLRPPSLDGTECYVEEEDKESHSKDPRRKSLFTKTCCTTGPASRLAQSSSKILDHDPFLVDDCGILVTNDIAAVSPPDDMYTAADDVLSHRTATRGRSPELGSTSDIYSPWEMDSPVGMVIEVPQDCEAMMLQEIMSQC